MRITVRNDKEENWFRANPELLPGELAISYDVDNGQHTNYRLKIGGIRHGLNEGQLLTWRELPFVTFGGEESKTRETEKPVLMQAVQQERQPVDPVEQFLEKATPEQLQRLGALLKPYCQSEPAAVETKPDPNRPMPEILKHGPRI